MRTRIIFSLIVLAALIITIPPALAIADHDQYQGNFTASASGVHGLNLTYTANDWPVIRNNSLLLFTDIDFYKGSHFQVYSYYQLGGALPYLWLTKDGTKNASIDDVIFKDSLTGITLGTGTIAYQLDLHNTAQVIITIENWNIGTLTGNRAVTLDYNYTKFRLTSSYYSSGNLTNSKNVYFGWNPTAPNFYAPPTDRNYGTWNNPYGTMVIFGQYWKNYYRFDNSTGWDEIWVNRNFDDGKYESTIDIDGTLSGSTFYYTIAELGTDNFYIGGIPEGVTSLHLKVTDQYGTDHNAYWNIPPGSACNFTAAVQNTEDGNVIRGAKFKIWDITKNTWQSFILDNGIGSVSIPYLGDTYAFNATKTGYTGYDADPPGGMVLNTCPDRVIYSYLSGPPAGAGNATAYFFVTNPDSLAIPNAQVCLDNYICQATNLAGTATFDLLVIGQDYNYTVTKEGYQGVWGAFTGITAPQIINVILTEGVQPTATITPSPTISKECPYGDVNCVIEQTMAMLVSIIQFVISISAWILIMTLIWMFIYVSSGRIPGYKGGMGRGGRGGFGGAFGRKKR